MSEAQDQAEEAGASAAGGDDNSGESMDGCFECNICLDNAKDAVVSMCGHLFCWPCLHQWLETRPTRQLCPVCKAAVSRDKVIPIYGWGSSDRDPRDKLPQRPPGQRTEHESNSNQNFNGFGFGDGGFHMSFGIGAFPFGFFASAFNFGDGRPAPFHGSPQYVEDQVFPQVFLWIAIIFILWLFLV